MVRNPYFKEQRLSTPNFCDLLHKYADVTNSNRILYSNQIQWEKITGRPHPLPWPIISVTSVLMHSLLLLTLLLFVLIIAWKSTNFNFSLSNNIDIRKKYKFAHLIYKLLLLYLGKYKNWFFSTIFNHNFYSATNFSKHFQNICSFKTVNYGTHWPVLQWLFKVTSFYWSSFRDDWTAFQHSVMEELINTDSILLFACFEYLLKKSYCKISTIICARV